MCQETKNIRKFGDAHCVKAAWQVVARQRAMYPLKIREVSSGCAFAAPYAPRNMRHADEMITNTATFTVEKNSNRIEVQDTLVLHRNAPVPKPESVVAAPASQPPGTGPCASSDSQVSLSSACCASVPFVTVTRGFCLAHTSNLACCPLPAWVCHAQVCCIMNSAVRLMLHRAEPRNPSCSSHSVCCWS